MNKNGKTNYGKIIAITLAVVAGACAVIWFALKLYRKYCLIECDCADELDEFDGDDLFCEDTECEVIMDNADETESAELADGTVTA